MSLGWRGESTMYRSRDENGEINDFADVLRYAREKVLNYFQLWTVGQMKQWLKIVELSQAG